MVAPTRFSELPTIWFLLILLGLGLLTSPSVQAQRRPAAFPPPTPAPAEDPTQPRRGSGYAGQYQRLDGQWQSAQIQTWENDRVYLSETNATFRAYGPTELLQFVYLRDTVVALRDAAVPRRRLLRRPQPSLLPAAFGRQLYHGAGFQLLTYDPIRPATLTSALSSRLLLRTGNSGWQVVPTKTTRFNQFMLALLGACPTLAPGLHAGQYHARRDAVALLQRYAEWQTRQQLPAAATLPTR